MKKTRFIPFVLLAIMAALLFCSCEADDKYYADKESYEAEKENASEQTQAQKTEAAAETANDKININDITFTSLCMESDQLREDCYYDGISSYLTLGVIKAGEITLEEEGDGYTFTVPSYRHSYVDEDYNVPVSVTIPEITYHVSAFAYVESEYSYIAHVTSDEELALVVEQEVEPEEDLDSFHTYTLYDSAFDIIISEWEIEDDKQEYSVSLKNETYSAHVHFHTPDRSDYSYEPREDYDAVNTDGGVYGRAILKK